MLLITFIILTSLAMLYFQVRLLPFSLCLFGLLVLAYYYTMNINYLYVAYAFVPVALCFLFKPIRRYLITRHLFKTFKKIMPEMSATEREAIEAGDIGLEKELFNGAPNWKKFDDFDLPTLTPEEQAFLDGPVEELCAMVDDWEITQHRLDLPEKVWEFIKSNGFFALHIPKKYGGKAFSPLLHSEVIAKLGPRSVTCASVVTVPNSLGPAELLLKYGTHEQKEYYLPRLAKGEEIPCFALTGLYSGSDAANMRDIGIVCEKKIDGEMVPGISLTINKRYITLAPVATIVGVAFNLRDPNHILGSNVNIGLTCALVPADTKGLEIGRYHFPMNTPFPNGPVRSKDMFIPLSCVIGGRSRVGEGWKMLMACLAEGRSISLPSLTSGNGRVAAVATGAYARIRRQFNVYIGKFEGIKSVLGRMAATAYITEACREYSAGSVTKGTKSAVASAIVKYHVTELARGVICRDAMDIHAGKAICMGPKNYLARHMEGSPIAITVEGANILTRCLIIYGQGAIRCHPYVLKEIQSLSYDNPRKGLKEFDKALFGHIGYAISNTVRSFVLACTKGYLVWTPVSDKTSRYFQLVQCFSANLAFLSDLAMLTLGGELKRKEILSAKLGDALSGLYMTMAVLKRYQSQGAQKDDLPMVRWACHYCLHFTEEAFFDFLRNFPVRPVAWIGRLLALPYNGLLRPPSDTMAAEVADLMLEPNETRRRLLGRAYMKPENNPVGQMEAILPDVVAVENLYRKLSHAISHKKIDVVPEIDEQLKAAVTHDILTQEEADKLHKVMEQVEEIISVDDFEFSELLP